MYYSEANEPHEDQVSHWADDMAEALRPWLKGFDDYEDKLAFFAALSAQLKDIGAAAHAAGMARAASTK